MLICLDLAPDITGMPDVLVTPSPSLAFLYSPVATWRWISIPAGRDYGIKLAAGVLQCLWS